MKLTNLKIIFAVGVLVSVAAIHDKGTAGKLPAAQPTDLAQASQVIGAAPQPTPHDIPYRTDWTLLEPELHVTAAVAMDLDSQVTMYQFNTASRWPLASLSKLMTAVIVLEKMGTNKIVTVDQHAMDTEGLAGDLQLGEQYTSGDLLNAMLSVSSNRAAMALADAYGLPQFVDQMQLKATQLGMTQTTYVEPTGLSPLNKSTILDLEKLVEYIYHTHPEIFAITRQQAVTTHELTKGIDNRLININTFAQTRSDFFGGKTGYTDEADGNLVTVFDHEGRKLLFVVFGTDDRFGQTDALYTWVKNAFSFHSHA
ncbi:MAG: D-alanyl-D-alanine carboxypeptidase [Patescibacteria group bacterium]|nr:D-alanyl-D-alanine carboxypeptidase [Patescibacteria group bacterium]